METILALCIGVGLSAACGFRVFVPLLVMSVASLMGWYEPAKGFELSLSEINFIAIWYKCSHISNFKAFFSWLKQDKNHLFKNLPCYQRMIHLINMHQLALHALHVALMKGQHSQYLWVDSTTLPVCKNQGFNAINH